VVRIVEGNVMAAPLDTESVDVVVSQEALLHIPDRQRALGEAFRVLKRGGRLAFTDWVAHQPLDQEDRALLWEGQAVQELESPASYRNLLTSLGFHVRSVVDLTAEWAIILKDRLACPLRWPRSAARSRWDPYLCRKVKRGGSTRGAHWEGSTFWRVGRVQSTRRRDGRGARM
jgi:SAM-dependent methyltransferase